MHPLRSLGSAISRARSSRRTAVAGARCVTRVRRPSQPRHRFGVAGLGPEHEVTRHPLRPARRRRRARRPLPGAVPCAPPAGDRDRWHRVRDRGGSVRRSPDSPSSPASPAAASAGSSSAALRPEHERQLGHRERRTQDRGHPQHVQNVLGEPAEAAQDRQPQGRRQRRAASLGPPAHQLQRPVLIERTARVR